MAQYDIYFKLRPPELTPADELCRCLHTPMKLMYALSYNPLHCMNCNLEIPLDTLTLSSEVVEAIANWRDIYQAIYLLWLDSGSYEEWAQEQLSDITSEVNLHGRAVQEVVNSSRRCYYCHFQDQSAEHYQPMKVCPICGDVLQDYTQGIFLQRICERNSIVVISE